MRGPSASLYGGGATAGVLNITTQDYLNTPLTGNAFLGYGSHNFWKGFGQFGGDIKNVDYRISLSRAASSGYRDHEGFWSDNLYGKAKLNVTKNFRSIPGNRIYRILPGKSGRNDLEYDGFRSYTGKPGCSDI